MLLPGCKERDGDGAAASPSVAASASAAAAAVPSASAPRLTATGSAAVAGTASSAASAAPSASAMAKEVAPYTDFGKLMIEAANVMVAAAQGEKVDEKWGIEAKALPRSDRLAGMKVSYVSVAIEAQGPHGFLKWDFIVTPAGEVQFDRALHLDKPRAKAGVTRHPPVFAAFVDYVLARMSSADCKLPLFDASRFKGVPKRVVKRMLALEKRVAREVGRACKKMADKGDGYVARLVKIRVTFIDAGAFLRLQSRFTVDGDNLRLSQPRWR